MELVTTIADARQRLDGARAAGQTVGLVPTMGYLHEGHASLIRAAARECGFTAVTIFVNPLQFAPHEDLDAYPRDLDRDRAAAAAAGADLVLAPSREEMYPEPVRTTVTVAGVSEAMEGAARPSHFAGVATVVAKLFAIAGPCRAYFGEKDFQQVQVVRTMARDLSFPVEVVACPTVREPDGLALSSRNAYLEPAQRAAAPVLHRALQAGRALIEAGEADAERVRAAMAAVVAGEPRATLDYVEVADPATLQRLERVGGDVRLLGAVRIGRARLIDNIAARAPS